MMMSGDLPPSTNQTIAEERGSTHLDLAVYLPNCGESLNYQPYFDEPPVVQLQSLNDCYPPPIFADGSSSCSVGTAVSNVAVLAQQTDETELNDLFSLDYPLPRDIFESLNPPSNLEDYFENLEATPSLKEDAEKLLGISEEPQNQQQNSQIQKVEEVLNTTDDRIPESLGNFLRPSHPSREEEPGRNDPELPPRPSFNRQTSTSELTFQTESSSPAYIIAPAQQRRFVPQPKVATPLSSQDHPYMMMDRSDRPPRAKKSVKRSAPSSAPKLSPAQRKKLVDSMGASQLATSELGVELTFIEIAKRCQKPKRGPEPKWSTFMSLKEFSEQKKREGKSTKSEEEKFKRQRQTLQSTVMDIQEEGMALLLKKMPTDPAEAHKMAYRLLLNTTGKYLLYQCGRQLSDSGVQTGTSQE